MYLFGNYVNDTLQFLPTEEGRTRVKDNTAIVYDYFIKDHLGNVRMVLTEEQKTDMYPAATMEDVDKPDDAGNYIPYYSKTDYNEDPDLRYPVSELSSYPSDEETGSYVSKVISEARKIGPGIALKVMAGDKVNIRVKSWYEQGSTSPTNTAYLIAGDLISAMAGGFGNLSGISHTDIQDIINGQHDIFGLTGTIGDFINSQDDNSDASKPRAFVSWILLNEQFRLVASSSGFEQVGHDGTLTEHLFENLPMEKSGYLYVYLSNEATNIPVFFDNLQVTHVRGALLEETHYYPFGLIMTGISSKAQNFGDPENKKEKFQGQEYNDDLGINVNEFKYRMDDPQIGRFWQIDPIAEDYFYNSVYSFSENHITSHIELEGLEKVGINKARAKSCLNCPFPGTTIPGTSGKQGAQLMPSGKLSSKGILKSSTKLAGTLIIAGGGPENPATDLVAAGVAIFGAVVATVVWITDEIDDSQKLEEETPAHNNGDGDKTEPQKGKRTTSQTDKEKQLEQVEGAQAQDSKDRPSIQNEEDEWGDANGRPKRSKIENIKKSQQNVKKQLKEKMDEHNSQQDNTTTTSNQNTNQQNH